MNETKLKTLGIAGITGDFVQADDKAIAEFEAELGRALPEGYRQFLKRFGSSLFENDIRFRYLEPSPWADADYGTLDLFYGLGGNPDFDLSRAFRRFARNNQTTDLLPIAHDAGSNIIGLDLGDGQFGRVLFWDRDTGTRYTIANSFDEFIDSFEIVR